MLINPKFFNLIVTSLFTISIWGILESDARASTSETCDHAAAIAAEEYQIPLSIMKAVTRVETGQTKSGSLEPWPWAVNSGGKGTWFGSKDAAVKHVLAHLARGFTNIDIGCFQLNYRWHGHAFSSPSTMLDPLKNARYAARFLSKLRAEQGDWTRAVGAYHSRTKEHAARYRRRFSEVYENLKSRSTGENLHSENRRNQFPLLQRSVAKPTLGSLVPLGEASVRGSLITQNGEI